VPLPVTDTLPVRDLPDVVVPNKLLEPSSTDLYSVVVPEATSPKLAYTIFNF